MQVNALGLIIAGVSVVTSGMQQILCGTMQKKHHISSHQLLANTAPLQVGVVQGVAEWARELLQQALGMFAAIAGQNSC